MFKNSYSTLYYSRLPQDMGTTLSQLFFASFSSAVLACSAQSMKAATQLTGNFPVEKYAECQPKLAVVFHQAAAVPLYSINDRLRQEASERPIVALALNFVCLLLKYLALSTNYYSRSLWKLTLSFPVVEVCFQFFCVWNGSTLLV